MKTNFKRLAVLTMSVIIAGCSARAVLVKKNVDYDPKIDSRIRIFYVNARNSIIHKMGYTCEKWKEYQDSRKSLIGSKRYNGLPRRTLKSISIGMPITPRANQDLSRSSFNEVNYFREFIVPAGEPIVFKGWYSSSYTGTAPIITNCDITEEFIPKAGKDYEVQYASKAIGKDGYCYISINEVNKLDQKLDNSRIDGESGKEVTYKKCK